MALYKIYPLKVPDAYAEGIPKKINDNQVTVGYCIESKFSQTKAIYWQQNGREQLLNLTSTNSKFLGINSQNIMVGHADGQPFQWDQNTGAVSLKGFETITTSGEATSINDQGEIVGYINTGAFGNYPVLWNTANSVAINLFAGVNFVDVFNATAEGLDINSVGQFVGPIWLHTGNTAWQSFLGFGNAIGLFLVKNMYDKPSYILNALNDKTQIVGHCFTMFDGYPFSQGTPVLYNSQSNSVQALGLPAEAGSAKDINNNGDAVGFIKTTYQGIIGAVPQTAVLWTLNGLVRTNLNHPSISDAESKGWYLNSATSINNNGYIVGTGYLNGDTSKQLPWLLKPLIPVHKIPVEYMLPQALWPGEAYDGPAPRTWPLKFPFPIPSPNPFQIVGNGFTHLNNILISKKIKETTNLMSDSKARKKIQTIADQTISEEMKKLNSVLNKYSSSVIKDKKNNI